MGPELVQQTTEKVRAIQDKMRALRSWQRRYADKRRRDLEFDEGDLVFVRVTPTTGIGRAIKSKKLTPRFIGPYQILKRVGPVAYQVALPPHLSGIHDVLHVSQLRKYIPDPTHVIVPDDIQMRDNLTFGVSPLRIVDQRVKRLRNKDVTLVKVLWDQKSGHATWELEDQIRKQYPELFTGS